MSHHWYEYLLEDLRTRHPAAFTASRAAHLDEGLQILSESFMQYPANSVLIEGFHIFMSSTQMPLAILASVQPPHSFSKHPQSAIQSSFLFWTQAPAISGTANTTRLGVWLSQSLIFGNLVATHEAKGKCLPDPGGSPSQTVMCTMRMVHNIQLSRNLRE